MWLEQSKSKSWDRDGNDDAGQLWSGIRKGNPEALSKLFCMFYSHLFNYGYKIVPQQDFVKDSIQELFVILWSKRNSIRQAYSVKSYLFHSLRRILLRNLKKHKNRIIRNQAYTSDNTERSSNIEELLIDSEIKKEQQIQLTEALQLLSARQKEVIHLKYYNGMSNTEIAYEMGINQQSVYNHVSKAIMKLQKVVEA